MRYTYIELSKYLHALSAVGIVYFFLNESIENALIYILFCCIFYFLSYIVFYKINSIFIKLNFILLYVGYLLSMPILFYNKGDYEEYGWKGIGAYKFDHVQTFDALTVVTIYLVLFVIIALIVDMALLKSYKVRSFGKNINYFNDLSRFSKYSSIFLFLLILQFYLSYLMFQYKIGVVGVIPEDGLLFRITGISYYYRYFIIPIIAFILIFSNYWKSNFFLISLVLLEAFVSGVFGVSRAIVVLHSLPVVYFLALKNRRVTLSLVLLYIVAAISYVTIAREFVFSIEDFHNTDVASLFDFSLFNDIINLDYLSKILLMIVVRVQGYHEFFATFFSDIKYIDSNLFLHLSLGFTSLNYGDFNTTKDIFNVIVPNDKAFGIPLDNFSYLYLSTKNIVLDTLVFFFLWTAFLITTEKVLNFVFRRYKDNMLYLSFLNFYFILGYFLPSVKAIFLLAPTLLLFFSVVINNIFLRRGFYSGYK